MSVAIAFSLPVSVTFVTSGGSAFRLEGNLTYRSNNTLIVESKERRAKIEKLLLKDLRDYGIEGDERKGTLNVVAPSIVVTPQGTANNGPNSFKISYDFGSNKPDARNMKSLIETLQREQATTAPPDVSKLSGTPAGPATQATRAGFSFTASSSMRDLLKQLNINDYSATFKSPVIKSIESAVDPAASPLNRVYMELSFLKPVTLSESSVSARYCKGFHDLTSSLDNPQLSMIFCPEKVTFHNRAGTGTGAGRSTEKPFIELAKLASVHSFANAVKTNITPVRAHIDVDDRTSFWRPAQRDPFGDLGPPLRMFHEEEPSSASVTTLPKQSAIRPGAGEVESPQAYPSMVQSFYQGGAELMSYFQK